ncbi:hypothetical protein CIPAW_05G095800 [Carya illinoinensis]|uniref:RING-type domain-containing protein n=2 Tax=Carya illinoinensis TaxID=32201 RepID=A0A8T1QGX8_CARIL|nr:hypothetical protein CIPAW_05G095800 [Carya illinoinensis]
MNCLVVSQSRFGIATIVFYTCLWIPLVQVKKALVRIVGLLLFFSTSQCNAESLNHEALYLPVTRFTDLQRYSNGGNENVEDTCSICLVEFEREDVVSQLSRCAHIFHMNCIERWVDQNQFTCPLCRSYFISDVNAHSHANCSRGTISRIPLYLDSSS